MTADAATLAALREKTPVALGRPVPEAEIDTLHKYLKLLNKWQKSQRLIGSGEPQWIVDNVIVDSLLFARALPSTGLGTLADVGSGAGIPGVPLAVVLPEVKVSLIESRQKRASFLAAAIRELGLRNCRLLNARVEDLTPDLEGGFDAVVLRCAGNPPALLPQLRRLLGDRGVIVASGPPQRAEITEGNWLELEGPAGPRRFWVYRVT